MDEPLLSELHEWTGHWWLPDNPDDKVPGVLTFDPKKGLKLRLIGGWEYRVMEEPVPGVTTLANEFQRWPMVHGLGDEKYITLLDVNFRSANSFSLHNFSDPPTKMELGAHMALVGCLLEEPEEPAFVAGIATVENLTQWAGHTGVKMTHFFRADGDADGVSGNIELTRREPMTAELGDVLGKLHQVSWQPFADQYRSGTVARIKENASVEFSSENGRTADEWIHYLAAFGDLVSMSTLTACGLISLRVYLPPTPEKYPEDHPQRNMRHEVAVYVTRVVRPKPAESAHEARQMILTLADLSFDQLLPRWMAVHEKFAAARGMILGLHYVTGGYIETQVVTAVAAAESFHRALELAPPMPGEQFRSLRKLLLAAVPMQFKSWLSDRIMRNEPTLKQRLTELATRPGAFMKELVPDAEKWAKAAGDARNTLAHVGASGEQDTNDLFTVVRVTEAVVIINLLHEVGVPEPRLKKALQDHNRLSFAVSLGQKAFA
jgi:hypothetical protein